MSRGKITVAKAQRSTFERWYYECWWHRDPPIGCVFGTGVGGWCLTKTGARLRARWLWLRGAP